MSQNGLCDHTYISKGKETKPRLGFIPSIINCLLDESGFCCRRPVSIASARSAICGPRPGPDAVE